MLAFLCLWVHLVFILVPLTSLWRTMICMQRIKHWYDALTKPQPHAMSLAEIERVLAEQKISLAITRKRVKNINFRVKTSQLAVSAPKRVSQRELAAAIQARLTWAVDAHEKLQAKQVHQPDIHHMLLKNGSRVKLWGEDYTLVVLGTSKKTQVTADSVNQEIQVRVTENTPENLSQALCSLYRRELAEVMPELFEKWQPVVGRSAQEIRIKKMTTRWGSCNVRDKRVWLSLYLAQYPQQCTEYVIVHELCHLHEANHSPQFWKQVENAMPDYKQWHGYLKGKAC